MNPSPQISVPFQSTGSLDEFLKFFRTNIKSKLHFHVRSLLPYNCSLHCISAFVVLLSTTKVPSCSFARQKDHVASPASPRELYILLLKGNRGSQRQHTCGKTLKCVARSIIDAIYSPERPITSYNVDCFICAT